MSKHATKRLPWDEHGNPGVSYRYHTIRTYPGGIYVVSSIVKGYLRGSFDSQRAAKQAIDDFLDKDNP